MITYREMKNKLLQSLLEEFPQLQDFFDGMALPGTRTELTLQQYWAGLDSDLLEDLGLDREELAESFQSFLLNMEKNVRSVGDRVQTVTVLGGKDKLGKPENAELVLKAGEIACVVGPTGSGKSRLLADIEWMAQGDTPTGRKILINGQVPPREWRFSLEHKLVAQLSQNMNFVVDMTAYDFIKLHAESRKVRDSEEKTRTVLEQANHLAGEPFGPETPVTALSGGQSRALMIADTAFLSTSPIVLIDEIENAGIDRKKALELLVREDKIVLMATHDPILALMGKRRIVIQNGGMKNILETTRREQENLTILEKIDQQMMDLRNRIRRGEKMEMDLMSFLMD